MKLSLGPYEQKTVKEHTLSQILTLVFEALY